MTKQLHPETIEAVAVNPVEWIEAAAGGDGEAKPKRFTCLAYAGGLLNLSSHSLPVVVDLATLKAQSPLPILLNHDQNQIVGHADSVEIAERSIKLSGVISGASAEAAQVVEAARNGFPWGASIGARIGKAEFVAEGIKAKVNGRSFVGPLLIARQCVLRETSFCAVGADEAATARIAASVAANNGGKRAMSETKTFDPELQAAWENPALSNSQKIMARFRAEKFQHVSQERLDKLLEAAMSGAVSFDEFDRAMLKAKVDDLQLASMHAERPKPFQARASGGGGGADRDVLEGAILARLGRESLGEKALGANTMQRARDLRATSMVDLCKAALTMDHRDLPSGGVDGLIRAAFSTTSLPGILGNAASKVLLDAYQAYPSAARVVARKLSAKDFRDHTGYRLTGASAFEQVGASGELKHGSLTDASHTFRVDTFGKLFGITRRDIVNDDLRAFDEIPRVLARGAATALERAFFSLLLSNPGSFFSVANANLIDDPLAVAGLTAALEALMKQTDQDGNPINVRPRFLLVPPELVVPAKAIVASVTVQAVGGAEATNLPSANPLANIAEVVGSPYLSADALDGSSPTGWYLVSDPSDVAAFGVAYLNGVENPVIEEVDPPADRLGLVWRGYFDFGVCLIDERGAIASSGE